MKPIRILIYTIAFDAPESSTCRQMARMLAASLFRTRFTGDLVIIKNSPEPIFLIERRGIQEVVANAEKNCSDQELADLSKRWKSRAREVINAGNYDIIVFLDVDCLVLQPIEMLFEQDDWDILVQNEPGRPINDDVFSGYLDPKELSTLNVDGINSGTWAVRANIYNEVMATWE